MPSGRTHDRLTLWSLLPVGLLTFGFTQQLHLSAIVTSAFLFSGLMFGPDLDIYSVQFKRWGKLRWLWLPYQSLIRHRSGLSHGLIVGTILRLFYLLSILAIFAILGIALAQLIGGFDWNWQHFAAQLVRWLAQDYRPEAIALFVGLEIGAMSHSLSDWFYSAYQRYQKNRPKNSRSRAKQSQRLKRSPPRRRK